MFWGGAPAPGPADGWAASLGGLASWACAGTASNDIAETKGMMILMRLDTLMRACPLLFRLPSTAVMPGAIDDSARAELMPADMTDLLWSAKSRYKWLRSRHFFVSAGRAGALLASRLDHVAVASPGHQAVLHLARGGEIAGEPPADAEDQDRDDQASDGAAAVVTGLRFWRRFGLRARFGLRFGLGFGLGHGWPITGASGLYHLCGVASHPTQASHG